MTESKVEQSELHMAAAYVVERFRKDEAQGYRSRDRQFAIAILAPSLESLGGEEPAAAAGAEEWKVRARKAFDREYEPSPRTAQGLAAAVQGVIDAYGDKGWTKSEMCRRLRAALDVYRKETPPTAQEGHTKFGRWVLANGHNFAKPVAQEGLRERLLQLALAWELADRPPTPEHCADVIVMLREAAVAIQPTTQEGQAVGWRHTLHMELGQTDVKLTLSPESPFGASGVDYDSAYHVTSEPLYLHPEVFQRPMAQEEQDAIRALIEKWRERQRFNEVNSEYDYDDSSSLCSRLSGRAEAQKECANELAEALLRQESSTGRT